MLYKEFHLDEPWDSEHNRKLIDRMPDEYKSRDTAAQHPGRTRYVVPVGDGTMFPPDRGVLIKEITDGTSKTIMTIEVDPQHAVVWTKREDLDIDLEDPVRGFFNGDLPALTGRRQRPCPPPRHQPQDPSGSYAERGRVLRS